MSFQTELQYWDILLKINTVKHTNNRKDILATAVYCQSAVSLCQSTVHSVRLRATEQNLNFDQHPKVRFTQKNESGKTWPRANKANQ